MTTIDFLDARARHLVENEVAIEQVATGFLFTEGPVWHDRDHVLVFSDIQGSTMYRWHAGAGITTFRKPSNMANGNAWDIEGRLLTCEHATSCVTRTERDGRITVIASHYQGKQFNSPNDIVVKGDGAIFFTDPDFGRRAAFGVLRDPELPFRGVYRIDPVTGETSLLVDDFEQPNGLCFSRDEALLYVNDTPRKHIRVFKVGERGALSDGRIFAETPGAEPGLPDGMKMDTEGNVYCTGPGGIHVFAPDGSPLFRIRTPEKTANFAFGDADYRTLYVTACTSLYRLRVVIPGEPQMRAGG